MKAERDATGPQLLIAAQEPASVRLAGVLEELGHDVVVATDGLHAWSMIQRPDAPALALVESRLLDPANATLGQRLRQLSPDRKPYVIMIVLGCCDDRARNTALRDGVADELLASPFDPIELRARIGTALRICALSSKNREPPPDELADLPILPGGRETLQREMARAGREGSSLGVGLVELDPLPPACKITRAALLGPLATRLRSTLRPYDTIARHDGNAFLIIVPGTTGRTPWKRLARAVASTPLATRTNQRVSATISIGFACERGFSEAESLLQGAKEALSRARRAGNSIEHQRMSCSADECNCSPHATRPALTDASLLAVRDCRQSAPPKILVADDDCAVRELLSQLLSSLGYRVETASNGAEALAILQRPGAPRLAIVDWQMPELDGLELCRRVKTAQATRPPYIVMLTGHRDAQHNSAAALGIGADDYMVKPFDHKELLARVSAGQRILAIQQRLIEQSDALRRALSQVKTLQGLIPICCHCKRIRDDKNFWHEVEAYVSANTESTFSHGLCPECLEIHYPDLD